MRRALAEELNPAAPAGSRERGASSWLGGPAASADEAARWRALEHALQAALPVVGAAIAPATAIGAWSDWALHLASSAAKQWELGDLAARQALRLQQALWGPPGAPWCIEPLPQDRRFADPAWRAAPYAWIAQAFLLREQWWQRATADVPGLSRHHARMVQFAARQWLDMVAPSNAPATNPVVLKRTLTEGGLNLLRGAAHALADAAREAADLPPAGAERYRVGIEVAATPGRVVMRNRLAELIRYAPATPRVRREPLLIVPAWIMKYYVLDLEPADSLVKFLVERGHTVYALSWKNPGSAERDLGMDDYVRLGVLDALDEIARAHPGAGVHAVGYCLGGTLLAAVAARLARERPAALATMTLLAAQTDFSEPGEISLFIDEAQVAWLEARMARTGTLDKRQMRATFQMLRSRDLVWSYRLATYLLGERAPMSALTAWNADGTRLPERMHGEYLHALYLDNDLAHGDYRVEGVPVSLSDLRLPVFSVGAVQDHVAPWRSVHKLHRLCDTDLTFVLTGGGHNVGIVNPPGNALSSHRLRRRRRGDRLLGADAWLDATPAVGGSWWTPWASWLAEHSSDTVAPPPLPRGLGAAPGRYVHET